MPIERAESLVQHFVKMVGRVEVDGGSLVCRKRATLHALGLVHRAFGSFLKLQHLHSGPTNTTTWKGSGAVTGSGSGSKKRQQMSKKSSHNGLRGYPEIIPHQKRSILSYLEPPKSHIGLFFCLPISPIFPIIP